MLNIVTAVAVSDTTGDAILITAGNKKDLNNYMIDYSIIDDSWTLFLDRDGVINEDKIGSYIFNRHEFFFMPRAEEAIAMLSKMFAVVVVVTNQRGIGKGLMTEDDLHDIHAHMQENIIRLGGRIDKIYFAPDLHDSHNRKPLPGMAYQAKADFPLIDFSKSIMVGNKLSDMEFGRNIGAKTIFIASTNPETLFPHEKIDDRFNSLFEFATRVTAK